MARDELARSRCPKCDKRIGVRPDQFGRRLRCPACQTTFQLDPPANPAAAPAAGPEPAPAVEPDDEVLADEAHELVTARPPQRVTATARFRQPPEVVFAATAFAVRRAGGEVIALDRVNLHLKFAAGAAAMANEHTAYVFPGPTGGSDLDIRASAPGGRADELLYDRIAAELVAYLDAHSAHALATARASPALPPPEPPRKRRRSRKPAPIDGLAIGGLIASALGIAVFCFPIAAVPLGMVGATMSAIALTQPNSNRGLAIGGLVLGLMAVVVSGMFFLFLMLSEFGDPEPPRERRERRRDPSRTARARVEAVAPAHVGPPAAVGMSG